MKSTLSDLTVGLGLPLVATAFFATTVTADSAATYEVLRSYYATEALPLNQAVNSTETSDGIRSELVSFEGFDNETITARLDIPVGVSNPSAVILLHGITQSYDQWWRIDNGAYSFPSAHRQALVDAGFAVLGVDLRNHGRRKQTHDFADPYDYLNFGAFEAARKMISQSVLDVRRSIDYLQSRDDLDAETVSLAGFSLGAQVAYISTAVDPRVDSAVVLAMPFLHPTPGLSTAFTAHEHYLPGLQGKNMMFVGATEDSFYSIDQLTALVDQLPDETVRLEVVESTHDLPRSTSEFTVGFLTHSRH